jgi:uncharacterized membrane protein YuzA (DUF378 family)
MKLSIFARFLLVIAGINYTFIALSGFNIFTLITTNETALKAFAIMIGASAAYFMFNRDFYLPFLGHCVVPIKTDMSGPKGGDKVLVQLTDLPSDVNVVFWAAQSNETTFENPASAYQAYENSGLVRSDSDGNAVIEILCPGEYTVENLGKVKLDKHVHYRYEMPVKGLYSRVFTKYIEC